MENRTLKSAANQNSDIQERLTEAKQDRDRLQNEFNNIMRQPFFARQSDDSDMQVYNNLKEKIDQRDREIAASVNVIQKTQKEKERVDDEIKAMTEVKYKYEDDIAKMNAHMDPSSITLGDMMKKLQREDPSRFREVMTDLEYDGREPIWYQMTYEEQLSHLTGKPGSL